LKICSRFEREIRAAILAGLGVVVRFLFLKPPKWIVKSTAGKPARSTTHEKLLQEHPNLQELNRAHFVKPFAATANFLRPA
jgi:hypothetical protein